MALRPRFAFTLAVSLVACSRNTPPQISGTPSPPSICSLVKRGSAVVDCQFVSVGSQETVAAAGLTPSASFLASGSPGSQIQAATITVVSAVAGSAVGSTAGQMTILGEVPDLGPANPFGPAYPDGGFASGYCFLAADNAQWVLEDTGFFQRDEQNPTTLRNDNLYRGGISEQNLLAAVSAAQAAPCPPTNPGPYPNVYDSGYVDPYANDGG